MENEQGAERMRTHKLKFLQRTFDASMSSKSPRAQAILGEESIWLIWNLRAEVVLVLVVAGEFTLSQKVQKKKKV